MEKIDFRKEFKELYSPPSTGFTEVVVPPMNFLMIDGCGDPNTAPAYAAAIEALYSVAYVLKFASKLEQDRDYVVPPLEGLWWVDDMASFATAAKADWQWTMMIMQPAWITAEMVAVALRVARLKKLSTALELLRYEQLEEGRSVQIMHVGPYADEAPTIARLHAEYLPQHGLVPTGKHHEIYLGDPRKTEPSKLKTVLRQPVR
ncbi:MAG TPA: GyrI-like domain-containing protein [Capsulimonadaceae bacterium]|jgi:hypothetical protein